MKGKLSPEGEVSAAYGAAMVAAFQVLINCLEESDYWPTPFCIILIQSKIIDISDRYVNCTIHYDLCISRKFSA